MSVTPPACSHPRSPRNTCWGLCRFGPQLTDILSTCTVVERDVNVPQRFVDESGFLGCDAVSLVWCFPMYRRNEGIPETHSPWRDTAFVWKRRTTPGYTPEDLNLQRHDVIHRNICQTFTVASFNKPEHNDVFVSFLIVQLDFMCLSLRKLLYRCSSMSLHYMYLTLY